MTGTFDAGIDRATRSHHEQPATTRVPRRSSAGLRPARPASAPRRVLVEGYELIGSVGVYEHERRYEQRIVVSLELDVLDNYDGVSDELDAVYDYDHAIRPCARPWKAGISTCWKRWRNASRRRASRIRHVTAVKVRIAKPDVLIACRAVGIEIVRSARR